MCVASLWFSLASSSGRFLRAHTHNGILLETSVRLCGLMMERVRA